MSRMAIPAPVGSSFCMPYETQLVVKPSGSLFDGGKYSIKDGQGNLVFSMKTEGGFCIEIKRRIYDATTGEVVLLMRKDTPCCGTREWIAFHGDTESESQLSFTLRAKSSFSSGYVVFLPDNSDATRPDFSVKNNSARRSSFIILFNGKPIAEAKRAGWPSTGYTVTVYPEVDRALIAALVLITLVEERNRSANAAATAGATAGGGGGGF
ncbi:unnamed protein product [Calypogeia fissa]